MTGRETDPRPDGQLFEEAAGWFARMRGPDAEASRPDFEAWLARGALHRSAYNRAAEIFALGKTLHEYPKAHEEEPAGRTWRRPAFAVIALAAVALFGGWATLVSLNGDERQPAGGNKGGAAQVTQLIAAAESRTLRLADGSIVRLQPSTVLDVRFTNAVRRSVLERGIARFQVAHEVRPFIVFAGGGSVTAHGTIFDVSLSSDRRVSVRLVEGMIDVELPGLPSTATQRKIVKRLRRGEEISFPALRPSTPQIAGSSKIEKAASGPTDFDNIRIADLIDLANRLSPRPIQLGNASIGEERLSGRFRVDDPELLCARIAALFDLVVDRDDPAAIVLRRKR